MRDNAAYNIVLTNDCAIRCGHCFIKKRSIKSLDIQTVARITSRILSYDKCQDINWGGGEPLTRGREYFRSLVSLECFGNSKTRNLLYSTFQLTPDNDWKDILNRFNAVMFSIDSYRAVQPRFDQDRAISTLGRLTAAKHISYTPKASDTPEHVARYYSQAADLGAEMFHVGFLYSESLIPPSTYLRLLDYLLDLQEKQQGPRIGFFHKANLYAGNPKCAVGWRAFDCFDKGVYFSHDGVMTSCYIMYSRGYPVPHVRTSDFLEGNATLFDANRDFIASEFIRAKRHTCQPCEYYTLCMGGCPYFTSRSENGVDYYCQVYKKIFRLLLAEIQSEVMQ